MVMSIRACFRYMLFGLLLAAGHTAHAQPADTLSMARTLRAAGKTRQAALLLNRWRTTHPGDANALWLSAQNEYWRKHFVRSRRLYRQAIQLQPDNLYLQLDHIESQLGMGRLGRPKHLLEGIDPAQQIDPHFQFVQAKQLFWSGRWKEARDWAGSAKQGGSSHAPALVKEIEQAWAPWTTLSGLFSSDSQPLQQLYTAIEGGWHASTLLSPQFNASAQQFYLDSISVLAAHFELGNRLRLPAWGTEITVSAGILQQQDQSTTWTAALRWHQRLAPGWRLSVDAAQMPYRFTLASIQAGTQFRQLAPALEWQPPLGAWAKVGALFESFEDGNLIQTRWAWVLSPPLKTKTVSCRIGYAYSFADAQENRFVSEKTIGEILANGDPGAPIPGIFAPYFTPEQMEVHAAIAVLELKPAKGVSLSMDGKYGFAANAQNPYLFLDRDGPAGNLLFYRGFSPTPFTPLEAGVRLGMQFGDQVYAEAHYRFMRNFFFEQQTAGLRLKFVWK